MNSSFAASYVGAPPPSSTVPETLADSLLEDLDDLSDSGSDSDSDDGDDGVGGGNGKGDGDSDGDGGPASAAADPPVSGRRPDDPRVAFYADTRGARSPALLAHLGSLRSGLPASPAARHAALVESNRHLRSLQACSHSAHSHLVRAVAVKFPELADLVPDPAAYRECVLAIGNEMDLTLVHGPLGRILPGSAVLAASVAGSTTVGRPFKDEEYKIVLEMCAEMGRNADAETELTGHVAAMMGETAPSVSALVGAAVAARLVGIAGGVAELSRIPACNIQVLGRQRASAGGVRDGSAPQMAHAGVVARCPLVADAPAEMRLRVLKAVSAKLALAARCDAAAARSSSRDGRAGARFRAEVEAKIARWDEPDQARTVRALPKPDLSTKKRRGGRRVRKMKERYAEGAVSKQMNQRAFKSASGEYGDDAMGLTLGMLDSREGGGGPAGSVRAATSEKRKMAISNTKASRKRAARTAAQTSGGNPSGMASSMVLTAAQGMELVDPDAARRAQEERVATANARWFGETSGFKSALPK